MCVCMCTRKKISTFNVNVIFARNSGRQSVYGGGGVRTMMPVMGKMLSCKPEC